MCNVYKLHSDLIYVLVIEKPLLLETGSPLYTTPNSPTTTPASLRRKVWLPRTRTNTCQTAGTSEDKMKAGKVQWRRCGGQRWRKHSAWSDNIWTPFYPLSILMAREGVGSRHIHQKRRRLLMTNFWSKFRAYHREHIAAWILKQRCKLSLI